MAEFFDKPNYKDDGAFITIRFNDILQPNHPARFIKKFLESIDLRSFEKRYKVGKGEKGRPPKDIKMMLGIILYAVYCRIYSAHLIEKATEQYSDFWIFTHMQKISHDKISDFINMHGEDIYNIFLETILLAEKNNLLSFEALYVDGFFLKANANKHKNMTKNKLESKEILIKENLKEVINKLQESQENKVAEEKEKLEKKLEKIIILKEELNKRIKERSEKDYPSEKKERVENTKINITDKDSEINMMKDGSYSNSYAKVCGVDSKADIIVSSNIDGHYDESHKLIGITEKANSNCEGFGKYNKVSADSMYNTKENCIALEGKIELISPTKEYEFRKRNPGKYKDKPDFKYESEQHCVMCTEGSVLSETEKYYDKKEKSMIYRFSNKEACFGCKKLTKCTNSKYGYKTVKIDERRISQEKVLKRYLSNEGKEIYQKRSHVAEVVQGDLKYNGKFIQFLRRGIDKVKVDSIIQDISWNLRRIYNESILEFN